MPALQHNALIVIRSDPLHGVWRVVCQDHASQTYVMARTCLSIDEDIEISFNAIRKSDVRIQRIEVDEAEEMLAAQDAVMASTNFTGVVSLPTEELNPGPRKKAYNRIKVMAPFLDPIVVMENFRVNNDWAVLVRQALSHAKDLGLATQKPRIYDWLRYLITFGFVPGALHGLSDRCGAPNQSRPYGPGYNRLKPGRLSEAERHGTATYVQQGTTLDERQAIVALIRTLLKPGRSYKKVYDRVLEELYVESFEFKDGECIPILPPPGQYPSYDHVYYLIQTMSELDRLIRRTTPTHFRRNHRGLHGKTNDGVLGPGHLYMIDSTVADVFLRSSINRRWLIGRPVVYWVIDAWSKAIVGLYLCLCAPSWRNAKCAIFCTIAGDEVLRRLLGFKATVGLNPQPTLPAKLLCDRGEYLSQKAQDTAAEPGFSIGHNDSYRPDLRGLGERFNRISKDAQFGHIPGAFDARREELELKPDITRASLTMLEYFEYLFNLAASYNLTAEKDHPNLTEIQDAGCPPTPAGIWTYGHEMGLGYQRASSIDDCVKWFLPSRKVIYRRNGPHLGEIRYLNGPDDKLATLARNNGVQPYDGYILPTNLSHIYADLPNQENNKGELTLLEMAPRQIVDERASDFDYKDAKSLRLQKKHEHRPALDRTRIEYRFANSKLIEQAEEKTAAVADGAKPGLSVPEARQRERAPELKGENGQDSGVVTEQQTLPFNALISKKLKESEK